MAPLRSLPLPISLHFQAMEAVMFWSKLSSLAVLIALASAAQPAAAQQMGRDGYNFPARTPSMSAQFDFQERLQSSSSAASTAAGMGALNQYVTQYNSSSTAIANMNQVNQTISGGSSATATLATDQTSTGSQDASASTKVKVDNSVLINKTVNNPQP
ncbi:hypothetical protein [Ferrovibrio terrae]|uniref:hypothetical protein n=1 Tax=Ferrovibrio terrae TaxID=2594003 RepID=UPI00313791B4